MAMDKACEVLSDSQETPCKRRSGSQLVGDAPRPTGLSCRRRLLSGRSGAVCKAEHSVAPPFHESIVSAQSEVGINAR